MIDRLNWSSTHQLTKQNEKNRQKLQLAQEKLKKQLGENLSKKYNVLNLKNCECSLYGFVTNHGT